MKRNKSLWYTFQYGEKVRDINTNWNISRGGGLIKLIMEKTGVEHSYAKLFSKIINDIGYHRDYEAIDSGLLSLYCHLVGISDRYIKEIFKNIWDIEDGIKL